MARFWRSRFWTLAVAGLSLGVSLPTAGQSAANAPGSLSGKLTDLRSVPLAGVSVILHNTATGAETHSMTTKNGGYRFAGVLAGEYVLEADSPSLGCGRLEGIVVSAGHEARVQTAIELQKPLVSARRPAPGGPSATTRSAATAAPQFGAQASELSAKGVALPPAQPAAVSTLTPPSEGRQPNPPATQQVASLAPAPEVIQPEITESLPPVTVAAVSPALAASLLTLKDVQAVLQASQAPIKPVLAAVQEPEPAVPAVMTILPEAQIEALPASGRRWQNFLLDTPASTTVADSSQASLRGASGQSADTAVDGLSTRLAFGAGAIAEPRTQDSGPFGEGRGRPNGMAEGYGGLLRGGRALSVSEAAIGEMRVTAGNVEAGGASAAGGRIDVETQQGRNQLHGQGFFFDRQNTWGARNPFTQWVTETAPATLTYSPSGPPLSVPVFDNGPNGPPESYTPPDHEMVWGLGAGSSVRRDKLFWFAALDGSRRNDPGLAMVKHPYLQTPSECGTPLCAPTTTGFFATPSNCQMQLLSARLGLTGLGSSPDCVSGLVQGLTVYSRMLGTSDGEPGLASLLGPTLRAAAQWVGFGRIDWQAAERHRFTLEGVGAHWNSPGGGLTRVSEDYGSHSFGSSKASEGWLLARWEAYLTPNLLAATQVSIGRDIVTARPGAPSDFEQSLLNGNAWGQLPQIVVDSRYGFTIGNPSRFGQGSYPDERLYHAQESVDWVHDRLLLKAGFEADHNFDATSLLRNQTGTYYYSKVEDFISDALVFEKFGIADALDPANPHNCGSTDTTFGSQPCYSYYSQTMGPTHWQLSTSDWAGFRKRTGAAPHALV